MDPEGHLHSPGVLHPLPHAPIAAQKSPGLLEKPKSVLERFKPMVPKGEHGVGHPVAQGEHAARKPC